MARRVWMFTPHRGGQKISPALEEETRRRIQKHAEKIVPEKASWIRVRFKGRFCYIDAEEPGAEYPMQLCRLSYLGPYRGWSLAFYTYSHEKYEESVFASGSFLGTPEEGLEIGAIYLR